MSIYVFSYLPMPIIHFLHSACLSLWLSIALFLVVYQNWQTTKVSYSYLPYILNDKSFVFYCGLAGAFLEHCLQTLFLFWNLQILTCKCKSLHLNKNTTKDNSFSHNWSKTRPTLDGDKRTLRFGEWTCWEHSNSNQQSPIIAPDNWRKYG